MFKGYRTLKVLKKYSRQKAYKLKIARSLSFTMLAFIYIPIDVCNIDGIVI